MFFFYLFTNDEIDENDLVYNGMRLVLMKMIYTDIHMHDYNENMDTYQGELK
jgi:hypothetical protein